MYVVGPCWELSFFLSVMFFVFFARVGIRWFFLTRVGIVSPEFLKKNRKISLVIVLSLSAIITPPDVVSQIIVSIPILILYEVSIVIAKIVTRNQDKALTNV